MHFRQGGKSEVSQNDKSEDDGTRTRQRILHKRQCSSPLRRMQSPLRCKCAAFL